MRERLSGKPPKAWSMESHSQPIAPTGPNEALEATGHSVRFVAGVGLYRVARASAWAFGVVGTKEQYPYNVRHSQSDLHNVWWRI